MNKQTAAASYDQIPYPSLSYSQSHPDRLATVARLLGMSPPPVDRCRVLELGCASGGNLIPMAYGLPESEFVGLDISARQIAEGQAAVTALDLRNIALRQMDILDADGDLGQFDYIIAHGVFSWVPRPVQDKLLEICKRNLAPKGVAYVSYNTYPGWHMLGTMRDMMLYHTRDLEDPQQRAAQARGLLGFLAESVSAKSSAYGSFLNMYAKFLQGELEGSRPTDDSFLLHDELEAVNEPIYFYQFAERAAEHGLQYLGEAEFCTMSDSNFPHEVSKALRQMAKSVVDYEQYLDFLRNRTLRQTLLCHDDVTLERRLSLARLRSLYVASSARAVSPDPDLHSVNVEKFRAADGAILSTDHPVTKVAMLYLAEIWPRAVSFESLLSTARSRLGLEGTAEQDDAQALATNLLTAYSYSKKLIELHVHAPHMALEVSERPVASPLARFQAQSNGQVTNLRHERVRVDEFDRYLLSRLDVNHDRSALVKSLMAGPVTEGFLIVQQDDEPIEDSAEIEKVLATELEKRLRWLARAALLIG
jgi:methyltransferase-like protein/2-polyprenyl-3-methyl-5-hydroxy-6-metoxy-1,4-benzoquinol methylase